MRTIIVIPARYDSSRFKGKVLANKTGKYLLEHTYEKAAMSEKADLVLIATDSEKVYHACQKFAPGKCIMTSKDHKSGTDRIAEAVKDVNADIIINLQADEPEIDPAYIDRLASILIKDPKAEMATLASKIQNEQEIVDPDIVKVITDKNNRAIYFSRSPIPYCRDQDGAGPVGMYLRHLGVYAFRKDFLLRFSNLEQSALEKCEKLEQLRAIENGYTIVVENVTHTWTGIDTEKQYEEFVTRQKNNL